MPPSPKWMKHLPSLRATAAELETPTLDRALIEELFGLSRRSAIQLMARIRRPRHGEANVIAREQLLEWLDALISSLPAKAAVERRRRFEAELQAMRATSAEELQARTTSVIPAAAFTGSLKDAPDWPNGISLPQPGLLALRFGSAAELLGLVLALAEDAAADYRRFELRLGRGEDPETQ